MRGLHSPQLNNNRDILVYLPPSYKQSNKQYPVLYMHDGQNLFDAVTSFAGEWQVDETMQNLSKEGIEAIVVGIPNAGEKRLDEYSPFSQMKLGGGEGDQYLAFLTETVKPIIDSSFRTYPEREHTAIFGSSMGGYISLYGFFHCPKIFGMAGIMSPSFWFARGALYTYVEDAPYSQGKIYLDVGTREHGDGRFVMRAHSRRYYASVRRMQRILVKKGYRLRNDLLYVEEKWAGHEERAWARRLPAALRFLLGDSA
ncbi:MAG: alpha/beta hydrolase-fold protein [Candidatus Promineifilaceae bacterium]